MKANVRNIASIEFRHLRYFMAAHEQGSFRKAGAALGVCESTISRAVRDLEDRLGASLFQRHVGGVELTIAGERFLERTRIALQQIGDGVRDVAAIGRCDHGHIRIGLSASSTSGFIADLLHTYSKDHPDVRLDVIDAHGAEQGNLMRRHQLDVSFIIGARSWPGCELETLWTERVFAVVSEKHALARKEMLRWSDLSGEHFIVSSTTQGPEVYDYLVRGLSDFGYHPMIETQRVSRDNLLSLVAIGRGISVVSESRTALLIPGVTYRMIIDEYLPFSMVWSPENDNPGLRRLLSMARQMSIASVS
jgi:DNA-binding transcriptional LysR family regulator